MRRIATICVFFTASYVGCLVVIAILVISRLLPNPQIDFAYGIIAPITAGVSLAITAIPCALFVSRTGGIIKAIVIGMIQGVLVPVMSIIVLFTNIPWSTVLPGSGLLLPCLIGSILSFVIAYILVNLFLKYTSAKRQPRVI